MALTKWHHLRAFITTHHHCHHSLGNTCPMHLSCFFDVSSTVPSIFHPLASLPIRLLFPPISCVSVISSRLIRTWVDDLFERQRWTPWPLVSSDAPLGRRCTHSLAGFGVRYQHHAPAPSSAMETDATERCTCHNFDASRLGSCREKKKRISDI
jgi:hypothetical protein